MKYHLFSVLLFLLAALAFSGPRLAIAQGTTQPTANANKEFKDMQEMLRPYLDPSFNPSEGLDKDRPSIKENARKIAEALPAQLSAPCEHKKRILVLSYKTAGQLHLPGAAGLLTLLREAEKKYGAFEITEYYTSAGIDAKMLSGFDAVVLNNISMNWNPKDDSLYNKVLPDYVKNGGGLFADHGCALLYKEKPEAEYNNMLGGFSANSKLISWMVHPKGTSKWNCCSPFPIKLIEPDNPLAAAFHCEPAKFTFLSCQLNGNKRIEFPVTFNAPLELADELYVISPESNKDGTSRCIVSVDPDKVPKESYPEANAFSYSLIWIKSYGKGRVYYSELGHNQGIFSVPCVARAMLDGLQYVDGDLKVKPLEATKSTDSRPAATLQLNNPIFPYFFTKFDGAETKLTELGYAPYEFLLAQVDFTKDAPLPYPQGWITWVKTKPGRHGVIAVKFQNSGDSNDEAAAITLIQQMADKAKESGIDLALYPYTGTAVDTTEKALPLLEKINRDNVGVTLQLIHEIKAGNSKRLPEIIGKCKAYLKLVVVCGADQPKEGDNVMQWDWSRLIRPLGEGDFDTYGFVKEVKKTGYKGPFGLICWGMKEPPLEHLTKSMATWKTYGDNMEKD